MKRPTTTLASKILIPFFVIPAVSAKETKSDKAVRAAEPIANPLPVSYTHLTLPTTERV